MKLWKRINATDIDDVNKNMQDCWELVKQAQNKKKQARKNHIKTANSE